MFSRERRSLQWIRGCLYRIRADRQYGVSLSDFVFHVSRAENPIEKTESSVCGGVGGVARDRGQFDSGKYLGSSVETVDCHEYAGRRRPVSQFPGISDERNFFSDVYVCFRRRHLGLV